MEETINNDKLEFKDNSEKENIFNNELKKDSDNMFSYIKTFFKTKVSIIHILITVIIVALIAIIIFISKTRNQAQELILLKEKNKEANKKLINFDNYIESKEQEIEQLNEKLKTIKANKINLKEKQQNNQKV